MIKLISLISLISLIACGERDNRQDYRQDPNKPIITISCEGPKGWVYYQTHEVSYTTPISVWSFTTFEGVKMKATNCIAVEFSVSPSEDQPL